MTVGNLYASCPRQDEIGPMTPEFNTNPYAWQPFLNRSLAQRVLCACAVLLGLNCAAFAQLEFEQAPINYQTAPVSDPIAVLQQKLADGTATLEWDEEHGYLNAMLKALNVPESSQVLVFSKTSLQLSKITPTRPRAIYFNDDAYVGWVQRGDVVELSSVDPTQGGIFYTLAQKKTDRPRIIRDRGQCLICHASSRTQGVPGHLVRSVFPASDGQPHFGMGTTTTNHTTPFDERFGGWYVTGTHGDMRHRGNAIAIDDPHNPIDVEFGANRENLDGIVRMTPYLQPGSDIVALMVLEHQSQMHNLVTRASYETRRAEYHDKIMNEALERPADYCSDSAKRRIKSVGDKVLEYMLFVDETSLTSPIVGQSTFTEDFQEAGVRDSKGRSLRDFDLTTRMFRYPCSWLIHSSAFDNLPPAVLDHIETRLIAILDGTDTSKEFSHLSSDDRTAILEILLETRPEFRKRYVALKS